METTGITWREIPGTSKPGLCFYWLHQKDLDYHQDTYMYIAYIEVSAISSKQHFLATAAYYT